jgi:hypothetical protein
VIPDPSGQGYVLLKILACFETTIEADAWVQDVASKSILDENIYVIPTCEWVYPNGTRVDSEKRRYRIDELQKIMDAADKNVANVQTYKEWMRVKHRGDETMGMVDLTVASSRAIEASADDEEKDEAEPQQDNAQGNVLPAAL